MGQKKISTSNTPYYIMMAPFLTLFFLFLLLPILSAAVLSLTDFNMIETPKFLWLDNYFRIFMDDDIFMIALKNTLVFAIITGPIGYVLSFVVAWLINELGPRLKSIVTLIVYAPALAGNIYFIWKYIFASDSRGLLNDFLIKMGFIQDPVLWLTDPKYNFMVVVVVIIWLSFGSGFLSFIAGLQALDRSYYEAAAVDGLKNRWQELYYVTLPQMGPQLLFGAVMSISAAFSVGYHNMALTGNPSTNYSTHTILIHMLDYGNTRYEMGYASALAVILFFIMFVSWIGVNKLLKRFTG